MNCTPVGHAPSLKLWRCEAQPEESHAPRTPGFLSGLRTPAVEPFQELALLKSPSTISIPPTSWMLAFHDFKRIYHKPPAAEQRSRGTPGRTDSMPTKRGKTKNEAVGMESTDIRDFALAPSRSKNKGNGEPLEEVGQEGRQPNHRVTNSTFWQPPLNIQPPAFNQSNDNSTVHNNIYQQSSHHQDVGLQLQHNLHNPVANRPHPNPLAEESGLAVKENGRRTDEIKSRRRSSSSSRAAIIAPVIAPVIIGTGNRTVADVQPAPRQSKRERVMAWVDRKQTTIRDKCRNRWGGLASKYDQVVEELKLLRRGSGTEDV